MEVYVLGLLGLSGYLLSKNESPEQFKLDSSPVNANDNLLHANDKPSVDNIYSGNYFNKTQEELIKKNNYAFQKSQAPFKNGVVPNNNSNLTDYNRRIYSQLAGIELSENEFSKQRITNSYIDGMGVKHNNNDLILGHNNMVPYFGGKLTQNTNVQREDDKLARITGVGNYFKETPKKEVEHFGDIKNNINNVSGKPITLDYEKDYFIKPQFHNNVLPFEQIRVGPGGPNTGFSSKPDGGFQQADYRQFQLDRSIDETRTLTNPKVTYEGRTVDGMTTSLPAEIGDVCKNRVDKHFEQTPDMYLKNGHDGNLKPMQKPCQVLKHTHRSDTQQDIYKKGLDSGNLQSYVSNMTTPLTDLMKFSKKEFTVMHPRPLGNFQNTNPDNLYIHDPNDVLRTTIKETTEDNRHEGFVEGKTLDYYELEDTARTTMKQLDETGQRFGGPDNNAMAKADAYRTIEVNPKPTDRQMQFNYFYLGDAQNATNAPTDHTMYNNAVINPVKEQLLKERQPTKTSVAIYNGIDYMNINNKSKMESQQYQTRFTQNYSNLPVIESPNPTHITTTRDKPIYRQPNRNEPELLNAFRNNPYTHSLTSALIR